MITQAFDSCIFQLGWASSLLQMRTNHGQERHTEVVSSAQVQQSYNMSAVLFLQGHIRNQMDLHVPHKRNTPLLTPIKPLQASCTAALASACDNPRFWQYHLPQPWLSGHLTCNDKYSHELKRRRLSQTCKLEFISPSLSAFLNTLFHQVGWSETFTGIMSLAMRLITTLWCHVETLIPFSYNHPQNILHAVQIWHM